MAASLRSAVHPKTHGGQDDICVEMYVYRVSQADEELMAWAASATLAAGLMASGYRACDSRGARLRQPGRVYA